jgi:hypothetical protein
MQESGDRIDLTLFTVCVRCGVVDNGPPEDWPAL